MTLSKGRSTSNNAIQSPRRTAKFSSKRGYRRRYRYELIIIWDSTKPIRLVLMLNPSKADEEKNDRTIERCERRAMADGYGGLVIVNMFALVSKVSRALKLDRYPVGVHNDKYILKWVKKIKHVVCAWGCYSKFPTEYKDRADKIVDELRKMGVSLWCLGKNKDGSPIHPLFVSPEATLERWNPPFDRH